VTIINEIKLTQMQHRSARSHHHSNNVWIRGEQHDARDWIKCDAPQCHKMRVRLIAMEDAANQFDQAMQQRFREGAR